jgi:Lrp/AsnC family transcriptional regulator, leucine-responsive regulatory protein
MRSTPRPAIAHDAAQPRMPASRAPTPLDALDLKILARYQRDTQVPARAIGLAVGLSTAAVQRRLKRLRADGVIEAEVAQVDPAAVGAPVTCLVGVDLASEKSADLARFRRRICACPEVQQCYYVTGQYDFMLVVLAADLAAYEAFTRRALLDDDNVERFTTHVVLDRVKVGLEVPLAAASAARRK